MTDEHRPDHMSKPELDIGIPDPEEKGNSLSLDPEETPYGPAKRENTAEEIENGVEPTLELPDSVRELQNRVKELERKVDLLCRQAGVR
jgi:hypothetical protein